MFSQSMSNTSLAIFDNTFAGRLFAVGNIHGDVFGKPKSFNAACDEMDRQASCGNGGNAIDILEVDKDGNCISKPKY